MRVLVIGASGFIGRWVVRELESQGHYVDAPGLNSPRVNLRAQAAVDSYCAAGSADALVHCAWLKDHFGLLDHLDWVAMTAHLLQSFIGHGGRRVVTLGTCFEYEFTTPTLTAGVTPIRPHTIYGAAKAAVGELVTNLDNLGVVSAAHARIGYVYGPGDSPPRLVPALIEALAAGTRFSTTEGLQRRDYLHVVDVAQAVSAILTSDVRGPINVGSGRSTQLRELVGGVAQAIGNPELVDFGALPQRAGEPDDITLDNAPLKATGWSQRFTLAEGIADTVEQTLHREVR